MLVHEGNIFLWLCRKKMMRMSVFVSLMQLFDFFRNCVLRLLTYNLLTSDICILWKTWNRNFILYILLNIYNISYNFINYPLSLLVFPFLHLLHLFRNLKNLKVKFAKVQNCKTKIFCSIGKIIRKILAQFRKRWRRWRKGKTRRDRG